MFARTRSARTVRAVQDATVADSQADVAAITDVLAALADAEDADTAVRAALDAVRRAFGWAYGSYWQVAGNTDALVFALESGSAGEEFRRVTLAASFREGVG